MDDYVINEEGEVVALTKHLNNDDGFRHNLVDYSQPGFMSSADKIKLDNMEGGGGSGVDYPTITIASNDLNQKVLDTFDISVANMAEYWIRVQAADTSYASRIMLQHDGADVYMGPEFNAIGDSVNPFGEVDADIIHPNFRLLFIPNTSALINITIIRMGFALS